MTGVILIMIGLYGLMVKRDLIKQVIAINIISPGVVLYFTGLGYVPEGEAPLLAHSEVVDPIPAALMLTTLVIDVAVTAFALALIIKIEEIDLEELEGDED
ncbi:MAG: cation:proton antiporter subunit C [Candidatus Thermoplasmatota archaeon]|nr:cation:proton antiporter subunit C [Candidatus Thermoplasmatota archaeon]